MKKKISHSVIVGIFITLGILLLAAAVFVLGGQQKAFVKAITVHAIFDDINGLQAGNNVWLFGMKVGTVKKINFYGETKLEVVMSIEKTAQSRIHKNASAKISTDGFIGNKIIILAAGDVKAPEIQDGDVINVTAIPNTDAMMATLQKNNENLLDITNNIKAVSKKLADGEGSLGQLLNDPTMAEDLKTAIAHFKNVSAKSEDVIAGVQQFAAGLNKKGTLTYELTNDTAMFSSIRGIVDNLHNTSEKLDTASLKVYAFTDSLQKAAANINDPRKPVGMILNDEQIAQNLKLMILNLESSSEKLNDDLEAVQHNFLLRGFFKKKEKAEKENATK